LRRVDLVFADIGLGILGYFDPFKNLQALSVTSPVSSFLGILVKGLSGFLGTPRL
jgi:hypothetical protein